MKENVFDRIEKITNLWFLEKPLYFSIYCSHQLVENNTIKIPLRTGQQKIEYSSILINLISNQQLEDLLEIEIIRILLLHPYQRQPLFAKKELLTLASNYTIYDCSYHIKQPIIGTNLFKLPKYLCFEEYYALIENEVEQNLNDTENEKTKSEDKKSDLNDEEKENQKKLNNKKNNDDPDTNNSESNNSESNNSESNNSESNNSESNNSESNNSESDNSESDNSESDNSESDNSESDNSESDNSESDNSESDNSNKSNKLSKEDNIESQYNNIKDEIYAASELWEENESLQEEVYKIIEFANNSDTWGNISGILKEHILANMEIKIDYRKMLCFFRTSILSSRRYLTRMKPNRRYGFEAMGSKYALRSNLLVAVDVSGSVTDKNLVKFYSIINHFFKYGIDIIDVLQFDAYITGDVMPLKKAKKNIEITGRGFTNFQPAVDYCIEQKKYDGLIYFTDGFAEYPDTTNLKTKILWIIDNKNNYNSFMDRNKKIKNKRVTYIPLPEYNYDK